MKNELKELLSAWAIEKGLSFGLLLELLEEITAEAWDANNVVDRSN